jgi:hypothetical protein
MPELPADTPVRDGEEPDAANELEDAPEREEQEGEIQEEQAQGQEQDEQEQVACIHQTLTTRGQPPVGLLFGPSRS